MPTSYSNQKATERCFLEAARRASTIIPSGGIEDCERPDFIIHTAAGLLGIEVTELLRSGDGSVPPVAEENIHRKVVEVAEEIYYRTPDATPVQVIAYFRTIRARREISDVAGELSEVVKSHLGRVMLPVTLTKLDGLPQGVSVIGINSTGSRWLNGESGTVTVAEIYGQLASRIKKKNKLVGTYRTRTPNSPIWLLVYSGVAASRGMYIPHGIDEWRCSFDFEKVLYFSYLSGGVVEIQRA